MRLVKVLMKTRGGDERQRRDNVRNPSNSSSLTGIIKVLIFRCLLLPYIILVIELSQSSSRDHIE